LNNGRDEYFVDVISASKMLGVSRRTFDTYLSSGKVEYNPQMDKRRIGMKVYYSESLISRLWVYSRRCENYSSYPNNRGAKSSERKKELGLEVKNTVVMRDGEWVSIGNEYLTKDEKEGLENG